MKNFSKAVLALLLAAPMVAGYIPADAMEVAPVDPPAVSDEITISPRADIIDWRYAVIDGVLHKRLWNYSKEVWIGNWEPA